MKSMKSIALSLFGLGMVMAKTAEHQSNLNSSLSELEPEFIPNTENDSFRKKHLGVKKRGYKFKK